MQYKRPRCDYCGTKLFPKNKPFSWRQPDWLFGEIPSHCPDCGKEVSNEKRAQLHEYCILIYCLWCIGFISFLIVAFVIFSNSNFIK